MKGCIDFKEKTVLYQPKVCIENENIVSLEALIRFFDKDKNFLNNEVIFKEIRSLKSLRRVTRFVIKQVIYDLKTMYTYLSKLKSISINISTKELESKFFKKWINNLFKGNEDIINYIEFEITENFVISNLKTIKKSINFLKNKGFLISLDDVGSGFNNFGLSRLLNVDFVKLDKSLIKNLDDNYNFLNHKINEFHNLGIKIIAEGVENIVTFNYLKKLNCDYAQGFYFSKAITINEIIYLLKNSLLNSVL